MIASCSRGPVPGTVSCTKRLPVSRESSSGLTSWPVELPITAESNCGSRARLAFAVRGLASRTPLMPSEADAPAVVGIDDQHEREHRRGAERQRAEERGEPASPLGAALPPQRQNWK